MLDPSWARVGPKLEPTGRSSAQDGASYIEIGPKWAPVRLNFRAKFDPSRWSQVGPLLFSLSYSLGADGSRREATCILPYFFRMLSPFAFLSSI